jgi:hypothetical protein
MLAPTRRRRSFPFGRPANGGYRARSLLCALLLAPSVAAGQTTHVYKVVVHGQVAGHLRVEVASDGGVRTDLSYRDNGRGPDIRERYRIDALGAPIEYEGRGTSTFGAEIREDFSVDGGRLRWQSRIDRGDEAVAPGTLFVPLEATIAYTGELARSLLKRDGSAGPVVGGHRLVARRAATVTVDGNDGPARLLLVQVVGIDTTPLYLWHRDDEALRFFAFGWPGFAVVAEGYEKAVPTLMARMLAAEDERLVALQKRTANALPGLTVIRNVRWLDAPAAAARGPSDIFLAAGRIASIVPPGGLDVAADM